MAESAMLIHLCPRAVKCEQSTAKRMERSKKSAAADSSVEASHGLNFQFKFAFRLLLLQLDPLLLHFGLRPNGRRAGVWLACRGFFLAFVLRFRPREAEARTGPHDARKAIQNTFLVITGVGRSCSARRCLHRAADWPSAGCPDGGTD